MSVYFRLGTGTMNEWKHADRRRFPRTNKAIQVELRSESSNIPLRTETSDICEIGCYVHLNLTLELGTRVAVTLWLGDTKISGTGNDAAPAIWKWN